MWDAGRDLFLGVTCVGCGHPGRALCGACAASLPRHGRPAWPTPIPPGLRLPMAAVPYEGLAKAMVNAHKERQVFSLARPLGDLLGAVARDLRDLVAPGAGVLLVPVPSAPGVVRARGHDPMLRVARRAAAVLRRDGTPAAVRRVLAPAHRVRDQAGLDAAARAANLEGSLRCRAVGAAPVWSGSVTLVVDDVITTGSTAREAQRALEEAGVPVGGIAAVAATTRRFVR